MRRVEYPPRSEWDGLCERPRISTSMLHTTVAEILNDVKENGDLAVKKYEEKFGKTRISDLKVNQEEIDEAQTLVLKELRDALNLAHDNIHKFHSSQRLATNKVETAYGVTCWQKAIAIQKVGLYIPGGTAPLSSTVLMLATPARIAGCEEIILCTPPDEDGRVNPAILVAASIAGVSKIFKVGGAQAIAAMAYGTETIPKVYKIFGPGNQYVMEAKLQVSLRDVAIDMPAGPSEVCVVADETSDPVFVAADLLSQAEHGVDSQVMFITTSKDLLDKVQGEITCQLRHLSRKDIAAKALDNSKLILVHDTNEAIGLSNIYAPEHLILATSNYETLVEKVVNTGSVFLGMYTCESAGDYASGTNHTLPTHGYAVAYGGVNLDSYVRKVTFQHIDENGIRSIGRAVEVLAENERLDAHKNAMTVRLKAINK